MKIVKLSINKLSNQPFCGKGLGGKIEPVMDNVQIQILRINDEIKRITSKRAENRAIWEAKYKNTPIHKIPIGPIEANSWSTYDLEEARLNALLREKARLEKLNSK